MIRRAPSASAWPDDLRTALRSVLAAPGYALPAIVSVMLGVGATVVICAVFSAVVLRPLPFGHEDGLVAMFDDLHRPGMDKTVVSVPELDDYRRLARSLSSVAAYTQTEATVTGLGEPRHVVSAQVTAGFFDTLEVKPLAGRGLTQADDAGGAMVSQDFWRSALGGAPAIGRTLVVDGMPRTIVGVLGKEQALPAAAEVWVPLKPTSEQATMRGFRFLFAIGRLRDGVSFDAAQRDLEIVSRNLQSSLALRTPVQARLVPLREELLGSQRSTVQFLLAAVAVFLLLACTNVASLLLTRASVRHHELAVRAALGAGPVRLVRESLLETLLLVAAGSVLGLGLAAVALRAVAHLYGDLLAYAPPALDGRVILFFIGVCLVTVAAIGVAPAWRAARVRSMDALRAGGRGSATRSSRRMRELLVCIQVGACVVLLIGAAGLVRSGLALAHVDPGFSPDGVVTGRLSLSTVKYGDDERIRQFWARTLESLKALPGTQAAAVVSLLPLSDGYEVKVAAEGETDPAAAFHAEQRHVTPDYFRALGVPLLAGRSVGDEDRETSEPVAVINRSFAKKLWGGEDAVGKRFSTGPQGQGARRVVGVVEDTRDFGLDAPARPTFFLPFAQAPLAQASLVVRGSSTAELQRLLPERVHAIDADVPVYDLTTVGQMLSQSLRSRTVLTWLLLVFAAAALLLAAIGLFGVTSYSVTQRTAELAIRRAIGASRANILEMVFRETGLVIALGVLGGVGGAWFVSRLMTSLMFGVEAGDAITFACASMVVFVVSLAAAAPPAWQAASVPPVASLKGG